MFSIEVANKINVLYEQPELCSDDQTLVQSVIDGLDHGKLRVCDKINNTWIVNEWVKKAILLYFRIQKISPVIAGDLQFFDKIPLKTWSSNQGVRVAPLAIARKGSFIEKKTVLMPCFVNIGAYVGTETLVDTWATVGSCAQIGNQVHLSGGVGIGGVLEPLQARPVIVEDNCFLGSRAIVVEGVHLEQGVVLGAGVVLTASTKILDVTGPSVIEYKGRVPANSVVIPGSQSKKFPAGEFAVPCALIIGQRTSSTDTKTSLTSALRDFQVSV